MSCSRRPALFISGSFLLLSTASSACHGTSAARPTLAAPTAASVPLATAPQITPSAPVALDAPLEASFTRWETEGPTGDAEHRARLEQLRKAVFAAPLTTKGAEVLFVCTHNSRRSHMSQLLALAAARRKGWTGVRTFSGGTEATAFNPRAMAALERVGFTIEKGSGANPHHLVRMSAAASPEPAFSKVIGDPANPQLGFIVVMTCSQADAACPYVAGASVRVAVPYEDPKVADGTPLEAERYDERVAQIGRDMAWVFRDAKAL